jgi:hypothetical protein
VSIVIHNYRCLLGLAEGEAKYDDLDRLSKQLKTSAAGKVQMVSTGVGF